ncbi:MAG: type I-F CRISPR-associated endoribonuclease Cas6/Csy4 [Shewanella sp.]|nr:type I-F CRISPR-associated endoribonuclease Cas6/Csy4 [Shewanella sp.]
MNHYIEIIMKDDVVMHVYNQIHLILASANETQVGVSFPSLYKIRLHSTEIKLSSLFTEKSLTDCTMSDVKSVPKNCTFAFIRRIRSSKSKSQLRRFKKRGNVYTKEQELDYKMNMLKNGIDELYIQMKSNSTKQCYFRFLKLEKSDKEKIGKFNSFGLSDTATIPIFD